MTFSVTIRGVRSNDLASHVIAMDEDGFWVTHVEALIQGKLVGALLNGGVQARPLGYDKETVEQELFITVPCTEPQKIAFEHGLLSNIGLPYGLNVIAGLAEGFLTGVAPLLSHGTICSGLVAGWLVRSGIIKSAPCGLQTTPRDVLNLLGALVHIERPPSG